MLAVIKNSLFVTLLSYLYARKYLYIQIYITVTICAAFIIIAFPVRNQIIFNNFGYILFSYTFFHFEIKYFFQKSNIAIYFTMFNK